MIFEALNTAADIGELLLVGGGMCHFHRLKDGSVTIREIIVLPDSRMRGIGRRLVEQAIGEANMATARCPADLPANEFWSKTGFELASSEKSKTGRVINTWRWTRP